MNKEFWDVLDFKGRPTGQTVCRRLKGKFPKGRFHLVVHIWVTNSRGEFLIQQRRPFKQPMAGEWAATGGAVVAGEQSEQGARRELFEELGINPSEGQMRFAARIKRRISFIDIWQVQTDVEPAGLNLQKEEVERAKWVSKEELSRMIKEGSFHNYGKEYFDLVFSLTPISEQQKPAET